MEGSAGKAGERNYVWNYGIVITVTSSVFALPRVANGHNWCQCKYTLAHTERNGEQMFRELPVSLTNDIRIILERKRMNGSNEKILPKRICVCLARERTSEID